MAKIGWVIFYKDITRTVEDHRVECHTPDDVQLAVDGNTLPERGYKLAMAYKSATGESFIRYEDLMKYLAS
ncbi:hypothetical protein HY407_03635 [Candidatus Gottesmanbacteria bacterium]|nr:hypothetical protein [Candidatus Gottesmanbacteria bacterium]